MNHSWIYSVLHITGADGVESSELLQTLWSGYGEIRRLNLQGAAMASVVLKHVSPATETNHPRGWNTDHSHQRKLNSYQIEKHWYQHWAAQCNRQCRVPHCYGAVERNDGLLLVLEDLDAVGFVLRKSSLKSSELFVCLKWLANFHARFMLQRPEGLWPVGTYWHFATRPDEWQAMTDKTLQAAAPLLDQRLSSCRYQTLVHGDAKLANFCFSADGQQVAGLDFQYVGGGCGIKDVVYFISSCLNADECERLEQSLLACYFDELNLALRRSDSDIDVVALEQEWRSLYAIAWADFYRFLQGWMPEHYKINSYSQRMTEIALAELAQ